MGHKLSGKEVDCHVGHYLVHFEDVSLDVEDGTAVSKTKGAPNGYTTGDIGASGEVIVDTANLDVFLKAAKIAGSFQELPTFDIVFNAATSGERLNIEAFECKLMISSLLKAKSSGGEKLVHTLPFIVTGKDFIRVNGAPYGSTANAEQFL